MNYQKKLDEILDKINCENKVPSLFLHSCCAPCSSYVLKYLSDYFNITVFYYNPNIYPQEEYIKRMEEQKKFINDFPFKNKVDFISGDYDSDKFLSLAKGLEDEKEGGKRCHLCYKFRLDQTAKLAKMKGYDFFTTTLTVSPYKNAEKINELGKELKEKYDISFLYSDFKKKNGYKESIELSKEYDLYRQDYCGCMFSKNTP